MRPRFDGHSAQMHFDDASNQWSLPEYQQDQILYAYISDLGKERVLIIHYTDQEDTPKHLIVAGDFQELVDTLDSLKVKHNLRPLSLDENADLIAINTRRVQDVEFNNGSVLVCFDNDVKMPAMRQIRQQRAPEEILEDVEKQLGVPNII